MAQGKVLFRKQMWAVFQDDGIKCDRFGPRLYENHRDIGADIEIVRVSVLVEKV